MQKKVMGLLERWLEKFQSIPLQQLFPSKQEQKLTFEQILSKTNLNDLTDRSYAQYLAQKSLMSPSKALILNLVGLVSTLPLIILCLFSRAPKSEKTNKSNAVFFEKTHEVLPQSLYDKYEITLANHKGLKLNFADLMFCIRMLTRYPFSFYFNFKIIYKLALYRYNSEFYNAKTLICCSEYSFTSSILTKWCRENEILHVNLQHGEKLYHIVDAFSWFDVFYVWESNYTTLLGSLLCGANDFVVEIPARYLALSKLPASNNKNSLTYFLQVKDEESWKALAQLFLPLKSKYIIKFRPHPRWLSEGTVNKIFKDFEIENPTQVKIDDSINHTETICSAFSAVLYLGYLSHRKIIVDDITNQQMYLNLKDLQIGFLNRPHILLSDLVKS